MRARRWPIAVCVLLGLGSIWLRCGDFGIDLLGPSARVLPGGFLVRPYLQLGEAPTPRGLRVLWQAPDVEAAWAMEYRPGADRPWRPADAPGWRRVAVPGVLAHRVYHVDLKDLEPGSAFGYRVRRGDEVVFAAEGRAPKAGGQPYRFAIFGDCGAGTAEERAVADQVHRAQPDFLVIAGDIVYTRGRIREYREKFWPVYDADAASPTVGAPLLRSTLFVTAPGNHDVAARDLGQYPDGLAYFLYWDQPLNGPVGPEGGPLVPTLAGPEANRAAFLQSAGPAYPRMANFSFDYGNAHWTVLDSNPYVDWTDPDLRAWVARDLAAANDATWRFVAFHHPPFNSSRAHFGDQRMRVLVDVLEAGRVDVVWTGHVHNYQRTFPLTFQAERGPDGQPVRRADKIPGRWTLDTEYDGRVHTRPRGVIYVITGGGGADLYYPYQEDDPSSWQPFTCELIARVHSLTVADVDGPTLTVRQLADDGRELDRFIVTKAPRTPLGTPVSPQGALRAPNPIR
jgi:3',5'-cyclic AMP phosphodiesterase CpdA